MDFFTSAFILLWIVTIFIVIGIVGVWRATRSPHLVLGLALVYYFSLAGAWKIVALKMIGGTDASLEHLEESLFPITIDANYLLTIAIYGIFNLALIVALRFVVASAPPLSMRIASHSSLAQVAHGRLLAVAALALIFSLVLIWGAIASALDTGVSAYSVSRGETDQFYTLHQICNRVGLDALATGFGLCVLGRKRTTLVVAYVVLALAWTLFLGTLGNRNELLVAGIAGVLWYYSLGGRIATSRLIAVVILGFFVMRLIESTRGWDEEGVAANIGELVMSGAFWNPLALATGTESLAAHISLYGILSHNLFFTYGSSLLYLVNSFVPRIISSERLADSYTIYANAFSTPDGQGFTIHYAAACYLNFGLIAVILGALIWAAIWGGLLRRVARKQTAGLRSYAPVLAAFCFCSAFAPAMIRGGPEGLKGLFIEAILIPYCLTWLAVRRVGFSQQRTVLPLTR